MTLPVRTLVLVGAAAPWPAERPTSSVNCAATPSPDGQLGREDTRQVWVRSLLTNTDTFAATPSPCSNLRRPM